MSQAAQAVDCFKEGFNCAQAILSTYGMQFDLNRDIAFKIASGFGGGMGRSGRTCGAVTGAFMIIGLQFGNVVSDDSKAKEAAYNTVMEYIRKFELRRGSIKCKDLIQYDLSNPKELTLARENNVFHTVCTEIVQDASEILEEILKEKM